MNKLKNLLSFRANVRNIFLISFLFFGCRETPFIKNKFTIKSYCIQLDSKNNDLEIKFELDYYSDSTIQNRFISAIEKGQDGTNDSLIGFLNTPSTKFINFSFDQLIEIVNNKEREYLGERLSKSIKIGKLENSESLNTILLIKRKDKHKVDTLFNCK